MGTKQRYDDRISGKIILKATLRNLSPLMIGKGAGDAADVEVVQWGNDAKPYIPASSLVGRLRQYLNPEANPQYFDYLGSKGTDLENQRQSHFIVDDLVPVQTPGADIIRRDGVRIDAKTNTAEAGKKYDYQVVEPGIDFPLSIEITLRNGMEMEKALHFVGAIYHALHQDEFYLGANSNSGLGKMECRNFSAWHFAFPEHADQWFEYLTTATPAEALRLADPASLYTAPDSAAFVIKARFRIKSSLITGAYGIESKEPDKSQLKSRNKFVISGKSIRGAIRHRALKILNTLGEPDAVAQVENLFGIVDEEEKKGPKRVIKGRLRVAESILKPGAVEAMVQERIRIDRFTGGVISGGLFSSEPIWTSGTEMIELQFSIHESPNLHEKKLLLLLLKDLWLADLAIGGEKNIGRGVLLGQSAEVHDQGILIASFERSDAGALHFTEGSAAEINALFQTQNEPVL